MSKVFNQRTWSIWGVALTTVFLIINVIIYVGLEQPIYTWDFRTYWTPFRTMGNELLSHPFLFALKTLVSVRFDDYNRSPLLLLLPFRLLLGDSRLAFILGISFYLLLVALLVGVFTGHCLEQETHRFSLLAFLIATLFVPFWWPSLRGLPDVVGLISILVALILVGSQDLSQKGAWKKALILGVLLYLPFLFRRWYAYTVISLYVTLPILNFLLFRLKESFKDQFKRIVFLGGYFLVAGLVSLAAVVVLQNGLLYKILTIDYSEAYALWQRPLTRSISRLMLQGGWLVTGLFFVSLILVARRPQSPRFLWSCFFLVNLVFSFYLFTRTQSPGGHHLLPFVLWILLICLAGVNEIFFLLKKEIYRRILASVLVLLFLFGFIHSLYSFPFRLSTGWLSTDVSPLRTRDFGTYEQVANKVQHLTRKDKKVVIVTLGGLLSVDLINSLTNDEIVQDRIANLQLIDSQGLNLQFLLADYLVLQDKPFVVGDSDLQKGVKTIVNEILSGEGLGAAYRKLEDQFVLEGGLGVVFYERIRLQTSDELQAYLDQFISFSPRWTEDYRNSLAVPFITALNEDKVQLDNVVGQFYIAAPNVLIAYPGEKTPTVATFVYPRDQLILKSQFKMPFQGGDGVLVTIRDQTGNEKVIDITDRAPHVVNMQSLKGSEVTFIFDKKGNSLYDTISLTY